LPTHEPRSASVARGRAARRSGAALRVCRSESLQPSFQAFQRRHTVAIHARPSVFDWHCQHALHDEGSERSRRRSQRSLMRQANCRSWTRYCARCTARVFGSRNRHRQSRAGRRSIQSRARYRAPLRSLRPTWPMPPSASAGRAPKICRAARDASARTQRRSQWLARALEPPICFSVSCWRACAILANFWAINA